MRLWTLFFIVCLELISNATRAGDPREEKVLKSRVAIYQGPIGLYEY